MNSEDYINGINTILSGVFKFKRIEGDPTVLREQSLRRYLRRLKDVTFFNEDIYKRIYPRGSRPVRIYI